MSDSLRHVGNVLSDRYRVERELGAGGMAVVYLAEDVRHQRKVALKVLHPELAAVLGADRFLAEITTTATLQHPGILPLFDSGAADGLVYYVMPFVQGESLRSRLDRERQLPLDDTVKIAATVASALDYAHRQGVIHRDVKPENILLQDGHALVADFGIALAVTKAGGTRLTQTGLSLGTPQYMSPEQAGAERSLDGRTDIYSLGAVCYEMLAGEPPFTAPTTQGIVAKLLSEEPRPLSSLRKSVPRNIEMAIHRALEKLPADRWNTAGEFAAALERMDAPVAGRAHATRSGRLRRTIPAAAAVIGFVAGILADRAIAARGTRSETGTAPVRHWAIPLPDSAPFAPTSDESAAPRKAVAISPDGSLVAYVGRRGRTTALHVVRLVDGSVKELPGTEGARLPAFSPDGRWLAFIAEEELRKAPADGGAVVRLSTVEAPIGLFWLSNERLIVSRSAIGPGTVPSAGGRFEPLGPQFRASSFVHTQPLPGTRRLLGNTAYGDLATISLETGAFQFIAIDDSPDQSRAVFGRALRGRNPHYLSSGHLVYASGSSLMAVPFDLSTLRVTGKPTPVVADVRSEGGPGEAHFAVSDEGTLVYAPGLDGSGGALVWTDQRGAVSDSVPFRAADLLSFRLSRDGRKLAIVERLPNSPAEARIADLARGVVDRARLEGEFGVSSWTADGRALLGYHVADTARARACCFTGAELDATSLALRIMEGPAPYRLLIEFDESPDGMLRCSDAIAGDDASNEVVLLRRVDNRLPPRRLAVARVQGECAFSPDGRWVAYTNRDGLFVTRATLDSIARSIKVAPGASTQARWRPDSREIVYRSGRRLFSVGIRANGDTVEASAPRFLLQRDGLFTTWDVWGNGWDMGRDGRLLVWQGPVQEPSTQLKVITNLAALAAQKFRAMQSAR